MLDINCLNAHKVTYLDEGFCEMEYSCPNCNVVLATATLDEDKRELSKGDVIDYSDVFLEYKCCPYCGKRFKKENYKTSKRVQYIEDEQDELYDYLADEVFDEGFE